jgi:hypothetical protein
MDCLPSQGHTLTETHTPLQVDRLLPIDQVSCFLKDPGSSDISRNVVIVSNLISVMPWSEPLI